MNAILSYRGVLECICYLLSLMDATYHEGGTGDSVVLAVISSGIGFRPKAREYDRRQQHCVLSGEEVIISRNNYGG